jgi:hypothetical protein
MALNLVIWSNNFENSFGLLGANEALWSLSFWSVSLYLAVGSVTWGGD